MSTVKALAIIFLAVYLILTGAGHFLGISAPAVGFFTQLLALASGVLLLVSLRHCCDMKHK